MLRCYAHSMIALLALVLTAPAVASSRAERDAEAYRLSTEIERLGQKLAWQGVERKYVSVMALHNVQIHTNVHLLGAHAALTRGDIRTAWERAQRATSSAETPEEVEEAAIWTADFWVNYGEVEVELSVAYTGVATITERDGGSFSPKTSLALKHANAQLAELRMFSGFLPMGRYAVGLSLIHI